jgi:hypothetical protein
MTVLAQKEVMGAQEQAHIRLGLQQRLLVTEVFIAVEAADQDINLLEVKALEAQAAEDKAALTLMSLLLVM